MLGAVSEGKVVGFCISEIRKSEGVALVPRVTLHIKNFAVDENYRRKGIGKALYSEAVKRGKAVGAEAVDLKVFAFNAQAVEFYKSIGMTVKNYIMEKQI